MRRVSVVGMSGSGKSTLARAIAERLGVPCIELDAIHHLPNWEPMPPEEFVAEVERRTDGDGWVVDGNYRAVVREGPVWERADTVVWLDLPKRTALRQVTWRSLRRAITREELWNGNRERLRDVCSLDPMRSMPAYVWTFYDRKRAYLESAMVDPARAHLAFVRLRSHAEATAWLGSVAAGAPAARADRARPPADLEQLAARARDRKRATGSTMARDEIVAHLDADRR